MPHCAATIGVFDGVHAGHRQVIKRLISDAQFHHLASMVITFDRQPRQLFDPDFRPQLLTTQKEKERELERLGIDYLVVLPFTKEIASLSAYEFMWKILKEKLNVKLLITGYDNRFGHDRTEGFEDYVRYGEELGIRVHRGIELSIQDYDVSVSSSSVRWLLSEKGEVDTAAVLLGHYYQLTGKVMPGEHIGHQLGFPTANLQPDDPFKLIPASGAYAVRATIGDHQEQWPAMMNIGTRPTFEGKRQTLEVHILEAVGNLYGQPMTVAFVRRLRAEQRFDTREALIAQLEHDRQTTEDILLNDK